ncbi:MAG: gamma-glutamyltransferase [Gemmatimonadaceae bacterium]|nr:gamma-glutamyltransferase [Gemmatimonadaceae bacterium]
MSSARRISGLTIMRAIAVVLVLFIVACSRGTPSSSLRATDIPPRRAMAFPEGWRFAAGQPAAFGERFMIASNERRASDAGNEIIQAGGNAVDAAVAVGFALAVTYPVAGNVGGGGFMVIRMADGRSAAIDYREVAPQAASRDMYLDAQGNPTNESIIGYRASGVPGAVAGMAEALAKYGTMPLSRVMEPAIRLARDGFVVDSQFHSSLAGSRDYITRFDGRDVFYVNGQALPVGTHFRQLALARTLQLIADQGPAAFYRGEVGDSLVAAMKRGGGILTKQDLENYRPEWRTPIRSTYRGYTLFTMPPASSGGVTITETMNMLETWDSLPSFGSAAYAHVLSSAYQRAFIDRNSKLADPKFVPVPIAELTSKTYARALAKTIDPARKTPTPPNGAQIVDGMHTTHYSVVDDKGNAVATTTTINNGYGSAVYLTNVGFFMNDEMDDFATAPGKPNMFGLVQYEQNAIAPGKRMLSAMSPSIVLDPKGELLLVVGAAGGPRIITATSQVILNVIDHRMSLSDAMRAPRLHHQALPDTLMYETGGLSQAAQDSLRRIGHGLRAIGGIANVNAVMRVKGGWEGVSEPRSGGTGGTSAR